MKTNKLMQLLKDNAQANAKPAVIRCEVAGAEAHIYVYDVIDSMWGASASGLVSALAAAGDKPVHMHINSPGGDVFEARAMTAAIAAHPGPVIAHIDGIAASAASYLALAASEVRMTDGGLFMVHNAWTLAMGNKEDFIATANLLGKIDGTIAADYMRKTGKPADEIAALMDAETWMTAQEALDYGFINAIDTNNQAEAAVSARWNLTAYANAPKQATPTNKVAAKVQIKPMNLAEMDYITAMISNEQQCVSLCTDFILTNPQDPMRDFAEDCLEDSAGDVAVLQVWKQVGIEPGDGIDDKLTTQITAQIQHNRNRLRLFQI